MKKQKPVPSNTEKSNSMDRIELLKRFWSSLRNLYKKAIAKIEILLNIKQNITPSNTDKSTPREEPSYLKALKAVPSNEKVGQVFITSTRQPKPKKPAMDLTKISLPLSQKDFEKLQKLESTEVIEETDFPKEFWEAYNRMAGEIAQERFQAMIDSGEAGYYD